MNRNQMDGQGLEMIHGYEGQDTVADLPSIAVRGFLSL